VAAVATLNPAATSFHGTACETFAQYASHMCAGTHRKEATRRPVDAARSQSSPEKAGLGDLSPSSSSI
jgi:hypothetical protein